MAENNVDGTVQEEYFRSYGNIGIHELMIKDKPRTLAYKQFMEENVNLIKNKVVLDVGAGTGILSLFAARSGASKVYAVEASDIGILCENIVKANKYERVITVIKGFMETVELPEKVDVIISEWMGFYLLHESMLESVLYARDKWLKEDGIMLPSHAAIYACPVNMTDFCKENIDCWTDVYDFDFTPLFEQKVAALLQQPTVSNLSENQLLSKCELMARYDMKKMEVTEIEEIEEQMSFVIDKDSEMHGFALWFDVRFTPDLSEEQYGLTCMEKFKSEKEDEDKKKTVEALNGSHICHVTLDTSPFVPETHWKQTVCFLPATISVKKSETIYCRISLSQETSNKRHYNISLEMLEDFESSGSDLEEEDEDHPVPCNCGSGRCNLILAIMEKYDAEQTELEMEAEFTDVAAEVHAAQTLDNDSSILESDVSTKDDSCSNSMKEDK
jgi:protein arginine N-methyltransferase 1